MLVNIHCNILYLYISNFIVYCQLTILFIAIVSSFYLKFSDHLITSIAFLVAMTPIQKKKTCKKGKFIFALSFQGVAHSRVRNHGIRSMSVLMRKRVEYQCCTTLLLCMHFSTTLINVIYITL